MTLWAGHDFEQAVIPGDAAAILGCAGVGRTSFRLGGSCEHGVFFRSVVCVRLRRAFSSDEQRAHGSAIGLMLHAIALARELRF